MSSWKDDRQIPICSWSVWRVWGSAAGWDTLQQAGILYSRLGYFAAAWDTLQQTGVLSRRLGYFAAGWGYFTVGWGTLQKVGVLSRRLGTLQQAGVLYSRLWGFWLWFLQGQCAKATGMKDLRPTYYFFMLSCEPASYFLVTPGTFIGPCMYAYPSSR